MLRNYFKFVKIVYYRLSKQNASAWSKYQHFLRLIESNSRVRQGRNTQQLLRNTPPAPLLY